MGANKKTPLHDLLIYFELPKKIADLSAKKIEDQTSLEDLDGWQTFIQKEGAVALKFFSKAKAIESKIAEKSGDQKKYAPMDLKMAQEMDKLCVYARAEESDKS